MILEGGKIWGWCHFFVSSVAPLSHCLLWGCLELILTGQQNNVSIEFPSLDLQKRKVLLWRSRGLNLKRTLRMLYELDGIKKSGAYLLQTDSGAGSAYAA